MGAVAAGTLLGSLFDANGQHLGAGLGALAGVVVALAAVLRATLPPKS